VNSIQKILKPLHGKVSWGISWDAQLNMEISFGDPVMKIREPYNSKSKSKRIKELASRRSVTVKGKWWMWIYCAHWDLRINDEYRATGASSYKKKLIAMSRLNGQRIISIVIDEHNGATEFKFDLGATLRVRRLENDDSDILALYFPNNMVLSIRGNGTSTYQDGSTPTDKLAPTSLKIA
jgi:hypothetical protein